MAKADPTVAESSRNDANQQFTLIGVQGTLGTADVAGTARTMTFGGDPTTGALYVNNIGAAGGGGGTTVTVDHGTITVSNPGGGTIVTVDHGTINALAAGTITGGTLQNLVGGSIAVTAIPQVSVGTIPQVSVGTLPVVSLASSGTILNLATGTISSSGTTTGVGVVTTVTTVSNLTNGSVNLLTGTVTSVTNLAGGTVQINPVPVPATLQFGTLGTAGGSFFGTLSAASGAGTKHYVTGYSIVMNTGTADVRILAGTVIQGTGVIVGGAYPAGGGNSKIIEPAFATGTNSELIYHFVGAGTAFITISYWKGV